MQEMLSPNGEGNLSSIEIVGVDQGDELTDHLTIPDFSKPPPTYQTIEAVRKPAYGSTSAFTFKNEDVTKFLPDALLARLSGFAQFSKWRVNRAEENNHNNNHPEY